MRHAYKQGSSSHKRARRAADADKKEPRPSWNLWIKRKTAEKNHAKHWEQDEDGNQEMERHGLSVAWIPDDRFTDGELHADEGDAGDRNSQTAIKPTVGGDIESVRSVSWLGREKKHDNRPTKREPVKGKVEKTKPLKEGSARENSVKGKFAKGKDAKAEAGQLKLSGGKAAPATGWPERSAIDSFKVDTGSSDSGIALPLPSDPVKLTPLADDPVGTGDSSSISLLTLPLSDDPVGVGDTDLAVAPLLPLAGDPVGSGTAVSGSVPLDSWQSDHALSAFGGRQPGAFSPAGSLPVAADIASGLEAPVRSQTWDEAESQPVATVESARNFKPEPTLESVPVLASGASLVSQHEFKPQNEDELQDQSESATKAMVQSKSLTAVAFQPKTKPSTRSETQTETLTHNDKGRVRTGNETSNIDGESKKDIGKVRLGRFRFAFGARRVVSKSDDGDGESSCGFRRTCLGRVIGKSDKATETDKTVAFDKAGESSHANKAAGGYTGTASVGTKETMSKVGVDKSVDTDVTSKPVDSRESLKTRPEVDVDQAANAVVGQSAFAFVYLAITIMVVIIGESAMALYLRGKIGSQVQSFLLGGGLYLLSCLAALVYVFFSERRTLTGHELHGDDQVRWITGQRIVAWPLILALALLLVGQGMADGLNLGLKALAPILHISPAILMSPLRGPFGGVPMKVYALLVLPLTEEIVFRGIIMNGLRRFGRVFAIITSAFLCAFMQEQPTQMIWAFLIGLVLGALAMEYGLIWSIVAHFLASIGYSGLVMVWLLKAPAQVRFGAALIGCLVILAGLVILVRRFSSLLAYARRYRAPKRVYVSWRQSWFVLFCLCSLVVAFLQYL